MDFMPDSPLWLIYLGIALGPFVQEDAAVFAAASLSANDMYSSPLLFAVILAGLILSDVWKYWIGWAALRYPRAAAFAERQHAADLQDKVKRHLAITLLTARFVPLARIPAYVACGFFGVSYLRFCLLIIFTATLYVITVFAICHLIGEILGEQLRWILPIIAVTGVLAFVGYRYWRRNRDDNDDKLGT